MCLLDNTPILLLPVLAASLPYSFLWSNNSTTQSIITGQAGVYIAYVTDSLGCARILENIIRIKVINAECEEPYLFVPTGFTPNGDGENDVLYVRGLVISEMYFAVYNRWGEKVFESTDRRIGWDGTYKGKLMDPAVYAYYVKAKCLKGGEFFKKGNVTLIR